MLTTRPTLQSPTTRAPTSSRSPVARTTASTAATARPRLAPSASSRPRPAPTSAVSPALLAPPTRTATTVSAREVSGTTPSCPSALSLGLGADPSLLRVQHWWLRRVVRWRQRQLRGLPLLHQRRLPPCHDCLQHLRWCRLVLPECLLPGFVEQQRHRRQPDLQPVLR